MAGVALALGLGQIPVALAAPGVASSAAAGLAANRGHVHGRVFRHTPATQLQASRALRQSASRSSAGTPLGGPWTWLGPRPITGDNSYGGVSGRITSLAIDPSNSDVVYAGSAGGGVWKTTDGGSTWNPLSDNQLTLAIGALAIDPRVPQTVYAGTGEGNQCGDCLPSQGVLKSVDGGASWVLLAQAFFTARRFSFEGLVVDAANGNVLAATNRGLYVSADGGLTWTQRIAGGVNAVMQDPSAPTTYWASLADWCKSEAGAIELSPDSGTTWKPLAIPALPAPPLAHAAPQGRTRDLRRTRLPRGRAGPGDRAARGASAGPPARSRRDGRRRTGPARAAEGRSPGQNGRRRLRQTATFPQFQAGGLTYFV